MNLINFMDTIQATDEFCSQAAPILRIVGIVVVGIQIIVPIVLIIYGMLDLSRAVMEKDEGKIKDAQKLLMKRAIAAVLVFLVITLVGLLMNLVAADDYKECTGCITNPWECELPKDELN